MATPSVGQAAREQFACPTADGAPLENEGGPATAISHWEAAVFQTELMVGASSGVERAVLSNVTLALAKDSGWYEPDFAVGGLLRYGFHAGCDLLVRTSC
jgi:leishmanolysin